MLRRQGAERYVQELSAFRSRHRHLRGVYLIHDNDPTHTAAKTRDYLVRCSGVIAWCQGLCGFSGFFLPRTLLSPHLRKILRLQICLIHLRPDAAQMDHPQVHDPLTPSGSDPKKRSVLAPLAVWKGQIFREI